MRKAGCQDDAANRGHAHHPRDEVAAQSFEAVAACAEAPAMATDPRQGGRRGGGNGRGGWPTRQRC